MKLIVTLLFIFQSFLIQANNYKEIPIKTGEPIQKVYPIAIIGSGAAGTMAAKRAVLNNNETLLFTGAEKERRNSRGNWVRTVDNVPGLEKYERTILQLRNESLQQLANETLGRNLFVIEESIVSLRKLDDCFELIDGAGKHYFAHYVLLATGIMDEQPHIQGSIRPVLKYANHQTILYCAVCDGHRSVGKETVVIGHSDAAGSVALLLKEKYQLEHLTILTNGHPEEVQEGTKKKLESASIRIETAPIKQVLGDEEEGRLEGFLLEDAQTITAEVAFISLGIRPNNQLAKEVGAQLDPSGLVITDAKGESSIPDLFIAGDLRANSMKQIYTAWQHAVDSLQLINKRIREKSSKHEI